MCLQSTAEEAGGGEGVREVEGVEFDVPLPAIH